MYAIVEIGGMQWKAEKSKILRIPRMDIEAGKKVTFDKILLLADKDNIQVGTPVIKGAVVKATIVEQDRDPKVLVYKKKRRKGYEVLRGHRQKVTLIQIDSIGVEKAASKTKSTGTVKAKPVAKKETTRTETKKAAPAKTKAAPKTAAKAATGRTATKKAAPKAAAKKTAIKKPAAKKAEDKS